MSEINNDGAAVPQNTPLANNADMLGVFLEIRDSLKNLEGIKSSLGAVASGVKTIENLLKERNGDKSPAPGKCATLYCIEEKCDIYFL